MTRTTTAARRRKALRALGERMRALRRARRMTQRDLADAVALSVAYISMLERGQRNPPITTVCAIASALGSSVADVC